MLTVYIDSLLQGYFEFLQQMQVAGPLTVLVAEGQVEGYLDGPDGARGVEQVAREDGHLDVPTRHIVEPHQTVARTHEAAPLTDVKGRHTRALLSRPHLHTEMYRSQVQ